MTIQNILKDKKMSVYRLSKASKIPYATVNDICNGRSKLEKCNAETVYRLARVLEVPMEKLLAPCFLERSSFENFKSAVCHRVKEDGDLEFIRETILSHDIRVFYERQWYPESLYLLAMLDYISRENGIPICSEYDDLRHCKLEKAIYPSSICALAAVSNKNEVLKRARAASIPEFKRFNIIESEVRNVV